MHMHQWIKNLRKPIKNNLLSCPHSGFFVERKGFLNKFIQNNEFLLEEVKKMLAVGKTCEIEALMNSERAQRDIEGGQLGYLVEFVVNRCIQKDFIDTSQCFNNTIMCIWRIEFTFVKW